MRISDWSSDVCSSDLAGEQPEDGGCGRRRAQARGAPPGEEGVEEVTRSEVEGQEPADGGDGAQDEVPAAERDDDDGDGPGDDGPAQLAGAEADRQPAPGALGPVRGGVARSARAPEEPVEEIGRAHV